MGYVQGHRAGVTSNFGNQLRATDVGYACLGLESGLSGTEASEGPDDFQQGFRRDSIISDTCRHQKSFPRRKMHRIMWWLFFSASQQAQRGLKLKISRVDFLGCKKNAEGPPPHGFQ